MPCHIQICLYNMLKIDQQMNTLFLKYVVDLYYYNNTSLSLHYISLSLHYTSLSLPSSSIASCIKSSLSVESILQPQHQYLLSSAVLLSCSTTVLQNYCPAVLLIVLGFLCYVLNIKNIELFW